MELNSNLLMNIELQESLSEMLDTCLGYVENVLVQEEMMESSNMMMM